MDPARETGSVTAGSIPFVTISSMPRQAVAKWETDKGIPDVGNLIAISEEFS